MATESKSVRGIKKVSNCCVETSSAESFFFFQAEDGIRDVAVTGVQTCALPILAVTDFLQMIILVVGLVVLAWFASDMAGGAGKVIDLAVSRDLFQFWPEPSWQDRKSVV